MIGEWSKKDLKQLKNIAYLVVIEADFLLSLILCITLVTRRKSAPVAKKSQPTATIEKK